MQKCKAPLSPLVESLPPEACCLPCPNRAQALVRVNGDDVLISTTFTKFQMMKRSSNHLAHLSPRVAQPAYSQTRHAIPTAQFRAATATLPSLSRLPTHGTRLKAQRRHRQSLLRLLLRFQSRRQPCCYFRGLCPQSTPHHPSMEVRCRNRIAILVHPPPLLSIFMLKAQTGVTPFESTSTWTSKAMFLADR
jgi:hypothetical protein